MAVDWRLYLAKKTELNKTMPLAAELEHLENTAAEILDVPTSERDGEWAVSLGYGMRTLALITPKAGVTHRFAADHERVVVKLFRGPAKDFIRFHSHDFSNLYILNQNSVVQQSVGAGVSRSGASYAILQYVEGVPLRSLLAPPNSLNLFQAHAILMDLIAKIWIPTWDAGLRFKDCHVGNFISCDTLPRLVMIDAEQMRKSVTELLTTPACWAQRTKHESSALTRLPNLIASVLSAAEPTWKHATCLRKIRMELSETALPQRLCELGRSGSGGTKAAMDTLQCFIERLIPPAAPDEAH